MVRTTDRSGLEASRVDELQVTCTTLMVARRCLRQPVTAGILKDVLVGIVSIYSDVRNRRDQHIIVVDHEQTLDRLYISQDHLRMEDWCASALPII